MTGHGHDGQIPIYRSVERLRILMFLVLHFNRAFGVLIIGGSPTIQPEKWL